MTGNRLLTHTAFMFLLPVIVAALGMSTLSAILLVLVMLLWRWAISLSTFIAPVQVPDLELETISASHFVEKVRWCMDRLGVDYVESPKGGTLGAFFLGRTVPLLKIKTGSVRSGIGNSPEILRYLWGAYCATAGDRSAFLEPTAERLALEQIIDRSGTDLQVWVYYHILPHRKLTLRAWGVDNPAVASWQRGALALLFPVLRFLMRRSFRISRTRYEKSVARIEALLSDTEQKLVDGRVSILGDDTINFVDITFAAIMGLWLQPAGFGAGKSNSVRFDAGSEPPAMLADTQRWQAQYPVTVSFVNRLYENHRLA